MDQAGSRTSRAVAWLLLSVAALLLASVAAYWYMSPIVALRQFQQAAQARDAGTLNAFVDYPRVRESLKVQLSARFGGPPDPGGSRWATMAHSIRQTLVTGLVEQLVRPEVMFLAFQTGKLVWPASAPAPAPSQAAPSTAPAPAAPASGPAVAKEDPAAKRPRWRVERVGFNRVVAQPGADPAASGEQVRFVFDRSGFDTWRMTAIELPK